MARKPRKTTEMVKSGYQPSKAETSEVFALRKRDGSVPTLEDIGRAVLKSPGKVRWIDKPKTRR